MNLGKQLSSMARGHQKINFFASIAFKYRPVEIDSLGAAAAALAAGFVPTTSGSATGYPPTVSKISSMVSVSAGTLAVASGMTPENIAEYTRYLGAVLVATGVSVDDYRLDPAKLDAFVVTAGQVGFPTALAADR